MARQEYEIDFTQLCKFTPQQWNATDCRRKYPYFLFGGRRGVKKSYWLRWDAILQQLEWHAQGFRNVRTMLACEDFPTLIDRQVSKIRIEAPLWLGEVMTTRLDGYAFHLRPEFGSGKICFRSLDKPQGFQGSEFASIRIDEIGLQPEFVDAEEQQRLFDVLVSSLRWPGIRDMNLACTGNPGGVGQRWVRRFFIEKDLPERRRSQADKFFYLAGIRENDGILPQEYWDAIDGVGDRLYAAWVEGDWTKEFTGFTFNKGWFQIVPVAPEMRSLVRYWDKAGTLDGKYTAGVLIGLGVDGCYYVLHVERFREEIYERERRIRLIADFDRSRYGAKVRVYHEQEPGSGGKDSATMTNRNLAGFSVYADKVTQGKDSKERGLEPFQAQAAAGNVKLVVGDWNLAFLDELAVCPHSAIRDQVDAAAGAFKKLTGRGVGISFPGDRVV